SNATVEGRAQNRRVEILINPDQRAIDAAKKQM
ncbi:OmpA family protein, partial [Neisseria sp. P0016.S002]